MNKRQRKKARKKQHERTLNDLSLKIKRGEKLKIRILGDSLFKSSDATVE